MFNYVGLLQNGAFIVHWNSSGLSIRVINQYITGSYLERQPGKIRNTFLNIFFYDPFKQQHFIKSKMSAQTSLYFWINGFWSKLFEQQLMWLYCFLLNQRTTARIFNLGRDKRICFMKWRNAVDPSLGPQQSGGDPGSVSPVSSGGGMRASGLKLLRSVTHCVLGTGTTGEGWAIPMILDLICNSWAKCLDTDPISIRYRKWFF